jgi:hypothetical protein
MGSVLRGYVFNVERNVVLNEHMYHLSRANIGQYLVGLDIDPTDKFTLMAHFDHMNDYIDYDNATFKAKLFGVFSELKSYKIEDPIQSGRFVYLVDSLIKHFNLRSK